MKRILLLLPAFIAISTITHLSAMTKDELEDELESTLLQAVEKKHPIAPLLQTALDEHIAIDINKLLFAAAEGLKYQALDELLKFPGANINAQDEYGKCFLHKVLQTTPPNSDRDENPAFQQTIDLLLSHGIDIHKTDANKSTILHVAAHRKMPIKTLQTLLARGSLADLNTQNAGGNTPLLIAASIADAETVSLFLANGANPNLPNNEGRTPLSVTAQNGLDFVKCWHRIMTYNATFHALKFRSIIQQLYTATEKPDGKTQELIDQFTKIDLLSLGLYHTVRQARVFAKSPFTEDLELIPHYMHTIDRLVAAGATADAQTLKGINQLKRINGQLK